MRIELAGGIASGKSTLAHAIKGRGVRAIFEDFSSNPFFKDFYCNPLEFAFQTEITYLLQHFSAIDVAMQDATTLAPIVSDYSIALDLAYARVTLSATDCRVFEVVLDRVLEKIRLPAVLVKLDCPPSVELQRIKARGRPAESAIELPYLESLRDALNDVLRDDRFKDINILRIDSESRDFRAHGSDRVAVVAEILEQLPKPLDKDALVTNIAKSSLA